MSVQFEVQRIIEAPKEELPDYGVSNAMFSDPFGYIWMLHQVHREVSLDERVRLWEEQKDDQ